MRSLEKASLDFVISDNPMGETVKVKLNKTKFYFTFTDLLHGAWMPFGQPFPQGTKLIISNGEWSPDLDSYCIETMDCVHTGNWTEGQKNTGHRYLQFRKL